MQPIHGDTLEETLDQCRLNHRASLLHCCTVGDASRVGIIRYVDRAAEHYVPKFKDNLTERYDLWVRVCT